MSTKTTDQFSRMLYMLVAVLACICSSLILLTWLQGPRVRTAQYDPSNIALAPNQRLTIQLNQTVRQVTEKQISITPSVPIKATSGGKTVIIQFSHPLLNNTSYTVHIQISGGRAVHYRFKTDPAALYYATDSGEMSQIYRKQPGGHKDELLFDGGHVDDYTVIHNTMVLALRYENQNLLTLYNPITKEREQISLPEAGTIKNLQAAPDGRSFGFIFTTNDYTSERSNTLIVYDLSRHTLQPVTGFGSKPVKTMEWAFANDSASIVVLGFDSTLLLLRPHAAPLPLGQYTNIAGFSYDNTKLYVATLDGQQTLNIQTAEKKPLPTMSKLYTLTVKPLHSSDGVLLRVNDIHNGASQEKLAISQNGKSRLLYDPRSDNGYVADFTTSPNDQYAVLEMRASSSLQTKAIIIDTHNGKPIESLSGGKVRWGTIAP